MQTHSDDLYPRLLGSAWWALASAVRDGHRTAPELKLHALRDFLYAILFGTLPWLAWQGLWLLAVMAVGVFLSGLRDLYAAFGLPHGSWPWSDQAALERSSP